MQPKKIKGMKTKDEMDWIERMEPVWYWRKKEGILIVKEKCSFGVMATRELRRCLAPWGDIHWGDDGNVEPGVEFETGVYKDGIGMKDKVQIWALKEETENVNVKDVEID